MRCPECQHENREGARFCLECGTKLELVCPQCGAKLPAEAKFCDECGTRIGEAGPKVAETSVPRLEDMHTNLQRYIPQSLAERMQTHGREMEGETRLVTAMFADISGFTPASAEMTPEELTDMANDCFKAIVDTICAYEGSVNRFLGDCVLAFFGAPIAHENDPERAIRAALDMCEAVAKLGRSISVGINTGMMYIGPVGTDLHMEYTAQGYQINLAKRFQEVASAGQVVVGAATHKFAQRSFRFQELPSLKLKGISQSVRAYQVLRVADHPGKLRGIQGMESRLIGREHDLSALLDAANTMLSQRRGQIVTIIGEAGIGKSRLVRELRDALGTGMREHPPSPSRSLTPSLSPLWLEGRCISIGQTVSFWPFIDIMREYLGISGDDSEKQVTDKLIERMQDLFGEEAHGIIPYVGRMLSVKLPEKHQERIKYAAPEQIRHQTLLRMRDVFVALARRKPLILVLEDLHWADDLSLDLLWILMDELVAAPMMIVCVHRPEQSHRSWQIDTFASSKHIELYTRIWLRPLTAEQSHEMVRSLLDIDNLPADIESSILHKAEGNPFFVEEVVRWMMEHDVIYHEDGRWRAKPEVSQLVVPDTVQSLILSRIDRLQDEVKYVLQCASVIGRVFQHRLLDYISRQGEELEQHISQLESNQLVYKEKIIPELEYAFKHALTQETTYHGLLTRQRSVFHELVGQGIEKLYHEQLEEYYEQLAYHYSRSDSKEKAIEYLIKAGQKAAGRYANEDALVYFHQALGLAKATEDRVCIMEHRAKLLLDLFRGKEAASEYEQLLKSAVDSGNRKSELASMLGLASAYYIIALDEPDFAPKSLKLYKKSYAVARELDDKACMAQALISTTRFMDFWPDYRDEGAANIEEASVLSREIGDETLIIDSTEAKLRRFLTPPEAAEQGEKLLKQLEARHDLVRLKEVYFLLMWMHLHRGNFQRCIECCDAGIRLAVEVGALAVMYPTIKSLALLRLGCYNAAWASLQGEIADETHKFGRMMKDLGAGMYFLELMAYGKASEILESVVDQAKSLKRWRFGQWALILLAESLIRAEKLDQANLNRITEDLESMSATLYSAPVETIGEIDLSAGQLCKALQQAEKACTEAEESGRRPDYVSALELRLRVLLQLDRPGDVIALADEGTRMVEEMSYLPMEWRIRAAKAQALEMLGNNEEAIQEYEAAAAIIRQLADTIPDSELKQRFMSNPVVSSIVSRTKEEVR